MRAEVASDTLVALSRNHFSLVMYELQHHLKPLNLTEEFVIVTLAKLANGNGRAREDGASAFAHLATPVPLPWFLPLPLPFLPLRAFLWHSSVSLLVSLSLAAAEIPSRCLPSCVFSPAGPSLTHLSFLAPPLAPFSPSLPPFFPFSPCTHAERLLCAGLTVGSGPWVSEALGTSTRENGVSQWERVCGCPPPNRHRTQSLGRHFRMFQFSSVQFSCSVVSDSLRPHESQHARPPCPSPTPGVHPNSSPPSQ